MNTSRFKINASIPTAMAAAALAVSAMLPVAASAADPYIQSDGTSGISTGYRMKGTSRLEVDFALTEQTAQVRIFGDDAGYETGLKTVLYVSGGATHFAMTTVSSTKYKAGTDTARHTAVIDLPNDKVQLFTGDTAELNTTTGVSGGFSGAEANMPLPLFGRWGNTNATAFANCAKARIYGVKIYESGVLVRDFVPCLKDGVACFKDVVNGGFIIGENASAFTAGGNVQTFADDGYVSTAANASGGKLYINTGLAMTQDTAVELDCAFAESFTTTSFWGLFESCRSSYRYGFTQTHNFGLRWSSNGTWHDDFTAAFPKTISGKDVRRKYLLDFNGSSVAVVTSGFTNQIVSFEAQSFTAAGTIKLSSGGWGNGEYAPLKIYGCKIWEDGALVRDFVPYVDNGTPGMRDRLTNAFVSGSDYSGNGNQIAYGGAIAGEQDSYLQSSGTANISTGYKMNGASRLEVDFSLTATNVQQRIFGTDSGESFKTYMYIQGDYNFSIVTPWGQIYPSHKADLIRHTGIIDVNHGWAGLVTGTTTNWSKTTTTSYAGQVADNALPVFGRGSAYAKERIYSVRIYESDALVHEFLPYSRGGTVGFYDTVTGNTIAGNSSFSFDGIGQDHGQLKAYVSPNHAATVSSGSTLALTAYAPGASSYRWLMDGEPVAGGTDGTFNVTWAHGGTRTENGYQHSYQAVAVFDFYGCTRESEPSAAETVTSLFNPFTLIFK